jgi:hypothetical protein
VSNIHCQPERKSLGSSYSSINGTCRNPLPSEGNQGCRGEKTLHEEPHDRTHLTIFQHRIDRTLTNAKIECLKTKRKRGGLLIGDVHLLMSAYHLSMTRLGHLESSRSYAALPRRLPLRVSRPLLRHLHRRQTRGYSENLHSS